MARGDYRIGKASIVGWALQADAGGSRWDGTPGTLRYMKPTPGGATFTLGADQNTDETMDVDPQSYTTGATKHNGSVKMLLSYEHQELIMIAMAGGADAVTGAGPYVHTILLADAEVYLTLAMYYENYKQIKHLRTYANVKLSQLTLNFSPEERPTIEFSWDAQSVASTTPGAVPTLDTASLVDWGAVPTLDTASLVDWTHVTATINSTTACINSGTFDVSRPTDDGDVTMGCDAPEVNTLFGSGQRIAQFSTELGMDDSLADILEATSTAVSGSLVCDNGLATVLNKKIELTFTALRATTVSSDIAVWGKHRETINWAVETWTGIVVTNSLSAAQL